jgi:uncharacterized spore protein YtfJ
MTHMTDETGVLDTLRQAAGAATAGRVFGTPVEENGVIMLPVAKVGGVGAGGGGTAPAQESDQPEGAGGGFGTTARGLGVFVLKDGKVSWHPAVDVNRIVLGGQLVAITALLVVRHLLRERAARRRVVELPRLRLGKRARGFVRPAVARIEKSRATCRRGSKRTDG